MPPAGQITSLEHLQTVLAAWKCPHEPGSCPDDDCQPKFTITNLGNPSVPKLATVSAGRQRFLERPVFGNDPILNAQGDIEDRQKWYIVDVRKKRVTIRNVASKLYAWVPDNVTFTAPADVVENEPPRLWVLTWEDQAVRISPAGSSENTYFWRLVNAANGGTIKIWTEKVIWSLWRLDEVE